MMYDPYYSYGYSYGSSGVLKELSALLQLGGLSTLVQLAAIAVYVFTALALYTMAQRRAIRKPWLAWIPVVNIWILGSLSDQYRYVVRGEIRSKRKILLVLNIVCTVLTIALVITAAVIFIAWSMSANGSATAMYRALLRAAAFAIPLIGAWLAKTVLRFMALYDIYVTCDPANAAAYLVLSILFSFTQPIFLFLSRNKELGMPPRREDP